MMYTVSITSQGQLNLPAKIRRQFGFEKAGKAIISVHEGQVVIEPVKDLLSLRGSLKSAKKLSSQQIRAGFEDYLGNEEKKI